MRARSETELHQRSLDTADQRLAALARAQHGVFTVAQAESIGISRRVLAHRAHLGSLERLFPRIYRVAAAAPTTHGGVLAACFAWGPGAIASHRCAARLWRLPGFERAPIELTVPRGRKRPWNHRVHRPARLEPADVTSIDAIPVTTIERTLLDLASVRGARVLENAVDDALRRNLTTLEELRAHLARAQGCHGAPALGHTIAQRFGPPPESPLERRLLEAIRSGKLPEPVAQHQVRLGNAVMARIDFAYPEHLIAIEADSFRWHSSVQALDRDASRQTMLASLGWRVIRVTSRQLDEEPEAVQRAIRAALAATPWRRASD